MKNNTQEMMIPLQIGEELRIRANGEIVVDNPEIELAPDTAAADAVLAYRFDAGAQEHVLRLVAPVADRRHLRNHRADD